MKNIRSDGLKYVDVRKIFPEWVLNRLDTCIATGLSIVRFAQMFQCVVNDFKVSLIMFVRIIAEFRIGTFAAWAVTFGPSQYQSSGDSRKVCVPVKAPVTNICSG